MERACDKVPMLCVESINSFYGNFHVLKDVSLRVEAGTVVTIIGANGSGKTGLLKTICGLIPVKTGEILFNGQSIAGHPVEKIFSLGISMVPEGREVFTSMTVRENLEMGAYCRYRKGEHAAVVRDRDELLDMFPVLSQRMDQRAGTLSGGEQQMLAIARSVISKPKLLLLDEPSQGLAPLVVKSIFDAILQLRKKGVTILLVEQNCYAALNISDRGYVMQTGNMVMEDECSNLLKNEQVQNLYLGKKVRETFSG